MCKSIKISVFAALTVMVFTLPAQSARRDGLNGNQLIEDYNDVFTFPQLAGSKHNKNRVRMNHAGGDATNGTLCIAKGAGGWCVNVAQDTNGEWPNDANTAIDAIYSGGAWGLRLSLGANNASQGDTESSMMDIGLTAGYTLKGIGEAALGFNMMTAKDAAETETSAMNIGINARGYKNMKAKVDLGWTVGFGFGNTSVAPKVGDEATGSMLAINAGAGPVYRLGDSIVALHGKVGFATDTDAAETATTTITVPGVDVAFETPIGGRYTFRGGVGYSFAMKTVAPKEGDEAKTQEGATTAAMGLSAKFEKLNFDVALNRDFLINGPYMMTGTGTAGWASKVSATYAW